MLNVEVDPDNGQLRSIRDPADERPILQFEPGAEFQINGRAIATKLVSSNANDEEHITTIDITDVKAYGAGQRWELRRLLTLGGRGLHSGTPDSLHIRYHLKRVPWGEWRNNMEMIWGAPLEAPAFIESLSALAAPTKWFGPDTRMRAIAVGGSGPREHVGCEDGPVHEVVKWLGAAFRSTFPGQMTVPGAMYYHPRTEQWLWVICRRPHVGGRIDFAADHQAFDFHYFQQVRTHDEIVTPDISLFWGVGLANADRVLAQQFDRFEEPPDWWFRTCWFWLHPMWQRNAHLSHCTEAVKILAGECGVRGFGLGLHDIPWSGRDIDARSLAPSPTLGGDTDLIRLTKTIREFDAHSYIWTTRTGLFPRGDRRSNWCIRGEDGRRISIRPPHPGRGVQLDILNNADDGYREYLLAMIRRYVVECGVDGLFWDSGAQPMPPDFTARAGTECPGETMTAPLRFYEEAYRYGKTLSPDFFMWFEGISTEVVSNAFAVDNSGPLSESGHHLMHRIAHTGRRRLVWRSAWAGDVSSAFPFIAPMNDIAADTDPATYRRIAADPFNRWLCRTVAERGCRQARGIAPGVSILDEFVVVGRGRRELMPASFAASLITGQRLRHAVDGECIEPVKTNGETIFHVPRHGAWVIEKTVKNGQKDASVKTLTLA